MLAIERLMIHAMHAGSMPGRQANGLTAIWHWLPAVHVEVTGLEQLGQGP